MVQHKSATHSGNWRQNLKQLHNVAVKIIGVASNGTEQLICTASQHMLSPFEGFSNYQKSERFKIYTLFH